MEKSKRRTKKDPLADLFNPQDPTLKQVIDDVSAYIVRYSLTTTESSLEQIIEERLAGDWKHGFFVKNKTQDLRILRDHLEAVRIVRGWYEVPPL